MFGSTVVERLPPDTEMRRPSSPGSHTPLWFVSVHVYCLYHPAGFGLSVCAKSAPGYSQNWPKLLLTTVFPSPVTSKLNPRRGPQLFHTTALSTALNV